MIIVCETPWGTPVHFWDSVAERAREEQDWQIHIEHSRAQLMHWTNRQNTSLGVNGARGSEGG